MIVIILLAVIFGFVIWRAASKRIVVDPSNTGWDELIHDPNTDASFQANFNLSSFSVIAEQVLKPLQVDFIKFMSNLFYVFYRGNLNNPFVSKDVTRFRSPTASIKKYGEKKNRPRMPLWFIAAFPDLLGWINEKKVERSQILYEGINEAVLQSWLDMKEDDSQKLELYKLMVENYRKKVNPELEIL